MARAPVWVQNLRWAKSIPGQIPAFTQKAGTLMPPSIRREAPTKISNFLLGSRILSIASNHTFQAVYDTTKSSQANTSQHTVSKTNTNQQGTSTKEVTSLRYYSTWAKFRMFSRQETLNKTRTHRSAKFKHTQTCTHSECLLKRSIQPAMWPFCTSAFNPFKQLVQAHARKNMHTKCIKLKDMVRQRVIVRAKGKALEKKHTMFKQYDFYPRGAANGSHYKRNIKEVFSECEQEHLTHQQVTFWLNDGSSLSIFIHWTISFKTTWQRGQEQENEGKTLKE